MELWVLYKEKNQKSAKDELIIKYVPLVKIVAGRLYTQLKGNVEFDDLVGYGILGLIDSIEKYDHKKANKFETYASIRIRGAILDQIRQLDWIPRSVRTKYKKLEEVMEKLQSKVNDEVTDDMIIKEFGITADEYYDLLSEVTTYSVASLEEKINENANFDVASHDDSTQPEKALINKDLKEALKVAITKLPERERLVLELYYFSELTYKEIGATLELTESRVSQIHSKAVTKLKLALS